MPPERGLFPRRHQNPALLVYRAATRKPITTHLLYRAHSTLRPIETAQLARAAGAPMTTPTKARSIYLAMAEEAFCEDRLREAQQQELPTQESSTSILFGCHPESSSSSGPTEVSQSQPTLMGAPPTREQMELLELGRALAIGSSAEYGSKYG